MLNITSDQKETAGRKQVLFIHHGSKIIICHTLAEHDTQNSYCRADKHFQTKQSTSKLLKNRKKDIGKSTLERYDNKYTKRSGKYTSLFAKNTANLRMFGEINTATVRYTTKSITTTTLKIVHQVYTKRSVTSEESVRHVVPRV